jgi:hypothetical protein
MNNLQLKIGQISIIPSCGESNRYDIQSYRATRPLAADALGDFAFNLASKNQLNPTCSDQIQPNQGILKHLIFRLNKLARYRACGIMAAHSFIL